MIHLILDDGPREVPPAFRDKSPRKIAQLAIAKLQVARFRLRNPLAAQPEPVAAAIISDDNEQRINQMILKIKLLKLTERGKAQLPPCMVKPHLEVNLLEYIRTYQFSVPHPAQFQVTVLSLLRITSEMFGCPLGFQIVDTESGNSTKEHLFDPHQHTSVHDFDLALQPEGR